MIGITGISLESYKLLNLEFFLQVSNKWTNDAEVERFDQATQIEANAWSDAFRNPNEAELVLRSALRNR